MMLISDRDKELLAADEVIGIGVVYAYCSFHLKEKFCKRFTQDSEPYFW